MNAENGTWRCIFGQDLKRIFYSPCTSPTLESFRDFSIASKTSSSIRKRNVHRPRGSQIWLSVEELRHAELPQFCMRRWTFALVLLSPILYRKMATVPQGLPTWTNQPASGVKIAIQSRATCVGLVPASALSVGSLLYFCRIKSQLWQHMRSSANSSSASSPKSFPAPQTSRICKELHCSLLELSAFLSKIRTDCNRGCLGP
jgi:hypothetical protein